MMRSTCVLCSGIEMEEVACFKPTPPANALEPTVEEARAAPSFPLRLVRCPACGLVQLGDIVERDMLFKDYKYATGAVPGLVRHFGRLASDVVTRCAVQPGALVMEIGSNDGTLLAAFAELGMKVLGVDPAIELASSAREKGVYTLSEHFDVLVAERIRAQFGQADILLANNVLAHVGDLSGVLQGIRTLLKPSSHAVFEVAHLLPMAMDGTYEFVYHEHVSYFSLHVLREAVSAHDMEIVHVEEIATQGGSLRCWVRPREAVAPGGIDQGVQNLLDRETACGLTDGTLLKNFAAEVSRFNGGLADVVHGLAAGGRRICGYGASARAVTLLAQTGVGADLCWVADDNPRKVGWFIPGSGIPVVDTARLESRQVDYCFMFAWNYRDDILRATQEFRNGGGRYIVPFPTLTVL